jgi:hypothetical protein
MNYTELEIYLKVYTKLNDHLVEYLVTWKLFQIQVLKCNEINVSSLYPSYRMMSHF